MINTQQLIVMMPLFNIKMPANASNFFTQIMSIAAFDFYDFTDVIHDMFSLEPTESFSSNFETIGFESLYFLINMGSIVIFYLIYTAMLCLVLPLLSIKKASRKLHKKLGIKLKWNALITLMNESYQIIVVCVLLNTQVFSSETGGLAAMSFLCVVFFAGTILMPAAFIGVLGYYSNKLKSKVVR